MRHRKRYKLFKKKKQFNDCISDFMNELYVCQNDYPRILVII